MTTKRKKWVTLNLAIVPASPPLTYRFIEKLICKCVYGFLEANKVLYKHWIQKKLLDISGLAQHFPENNGFS